jgi:large subunit ribosomal protein L29
LKVNDLREMTDDELVRRLDETRQELFNLRFRHATGALEDPAALGRVKRDIARLLTISHERAAAAQKGQTS